MAVDLIINKEMQKTCTQFVITRSAVTKADLRAGDLTIDDIYQAMPFESDIRYVPRLTAEQAKCVFIWLNLGLWGLGGQTI